MHFPHLFSFIMSGSNLCSASHLFVSTWSFSLHKLFRLNPCHSIVMLKSLGSSHYLFDMGKIGELFLSLKKLHAWLVKIKLGKPCSVVLKKVSYVIPLPGERRYIPSIITPTPITCIMNAPSGLVNQTLQGG